MDKYEYNLKLEEIDKLVDQEDYKEAAALADTIDWRRVRNIRTLCLISEIYEAAGRLEDSKSMLVRAYRKSPVGRTVLYRLVEVTTALKQYDEALEYYSEYVQAAPHDNNRYILKYMIYKGRGSSNAELIAILQEYLGQEYTERWAYELATLYQKDGQMENCFAVCDDLVLWFHSGKYVKKALELKQRYTSLTPRQKQIYEECLQQEAKIEYLDEPEEETVIPVADTTKDEVIAETIMSETEKEIADEITARKAEMERETERREAEEKKTEKKEDAAGAKEQNTRVMPRFLFGKKDKKKAAADKKSGKKPVQKEEPEEELHIETVTGGEQRLTNGEMQRQEMQRQEMRTDRESDENQTYAGQASVKEQAAKENDPLSKQNRSEEPLSLEQPGMTEQPQSVSSYEQDPQKLQVELAKSVRQIISGVVKRPELHEEDVPAAVENRLNHVQSLSIPEVRESAPGKLSIDDILLSMGEKNRRIAQKVRQAQQMSAPPAGDGERQSGTAASALGMEGQPGLAASAGGVEGQPGTAAAVKREEGLPDTAGNPQDDGMQNRPEMQQQAAPTGPKRSIAEAAAAELTEEQLEALKYADNPERFLKNRSSLPTYAEGTAGDDLGKTRRIANKEELINAARRELMATKTIRIPTEEVARAYARSSASGRDEAAAAQTTGISSDEERAVKTDQPQEERAYTGAAADTGAENDRTGTESRAGAESRRSGAETDAGAESGRSGAEIDAGAENSRSGSETYAGPESGRSGAETDAGAENSRSGSETYAGPENGGAGTETWTGPVAEPESGISGAASNVGQESGRTAAAGYAEAEAGSAKEPNGGPAAEGKLRGEAGLSTGDEEAFDEDFDEPLTIPQHLRGLFSGFMDIEGLEEQIANAILQAESKGTDKTSRTGNILIFGAHASGKTTLAMNIAKAIAQDRGSQVMKIARIYAADLNRKDIAATIAKIAGGLLIIEEAGDLEDGTVDQLTTAMEFRTDGLIVVLEDEQHYVHDLLMRHPRFTMKFTAQIYLPVYTAQELATIAQRHARSQDYIISEEAVDLLMKRVSESAEAGREVSIGDVIELVNRAIQKSNKFLRKVSRGKKRYDENDYIILFAKDFK